MAANNGDNSRLKWRVVDMVTAAVLGVAIGIIFMAWTLVTDVPRDVLDAFTPGLSGLFFGGWLIGGTLGGLIIRKPGAAILVEVIAASVEALLGAHWGITALFSGIIQGIGVEVVLAIFAYQRFSILIAGIAGAVSALFEWVLELVLFGNLEKGPTYLTIYLIAGMVSSAVIAGVGGWLITKGLAKTGALDRFAAGREVRTRV